MLKQDFYPSRQGGYHVWLDEIRREFLLSFFDLVKCWDTLAVDPENIMSLNPESNRDVSRFCALLHFCFLAWDAGLDTRARHGQQTEFKLSTTGGLARPEQAFRSAATDIVFRGAKEFAAGLLWEHADPLAELYCKWIHQYWNVFGPLERSELRGRYCHAFQSMHNFVRLLSSLCAFLCGPLVRRS